MKVRRNQPCPCGSGKKFKKCCGGVNAAGSSPPMADRAQEMRRILDRHEAAERIRETQQGLGRPIVSVETKDHRIVAVGTTVHWGKNWKTFPDFLDHYLKEKLGAAWGDAELAKPLAERHPLMQLFAAYGEYRKAHQVVEGGMASAEMTGAVMCFTGLAYGLYLLDHNVELQERLLRRLKDRGNFQGAFYEVAVARMLIRAGFRLELEDETDGATKHCEFSAVSKTGKKYWVEARMRSINGVLGKGPLDGGSEAKPLRRLIQHLNGAFAKPATDARLIFIDLNTSEGLGGDPAAPPWLKPTVNRLEEYERKELKAGDSAYVFVTNLAYHRQLDSRLTGSMLSYSVGDDFGKVFLDEPPSARYRRERRHRDGHDIAEAFQHEALLPQTFDGSLPSETFGTKKRPLIGENYRVAGERDGEEIVGTLVGAIVLEAESNAYLSLQTPEGAFVHVKERMTVDELHDYRRNKEAYFGKVVHVGGNAGGDPYKLFKFFFEAHTGTPRGTLIERLAHTRYADQLPTWSDEDLLMFYCECLVRGAMDRHTPSPAGPPPAGTAGA